MTCGNCAAVEEMLTGVQAENRKLRHERDNAIALAAGDRARFDVEKRAFIRQAEGLREALREAIQLADEGVHDTASYAERQRLVAILEAR